MTNKRLNKILETQARLRFERERYEERQKYEAYVRDRKAEEFRQKKINQVETEKPLTLLEEVKIFHAAAVHTRKLLAFNEKNFRDKSIASSPTSHPFR